MADWKPETIARKAARELNPQPQLVSRFGNRKKSKSINQPLAVRALASQIYSHLLEKHKDKVKLKGQPYMAILQGTATSLARAKLGLTMSMSSRRKLYNRHKLQASHIRTKLGLQDPLIREGNGVKDMIQRGRAARQRAAELGPYLHEHHMEPAKGQVKHLDLDGI